MLQSRQDWRQGDGLQSQVPTDPAHEAGQSALQARDASADDTHQLHRDQRRSRGTAVSRSGQGGETGPGVT